MILFNSNSSQNVFQAQSILKWQCDDMPRQLNIGDPVFIKSNGNDTIHFLGIVESITREPQLSWSNHWIAKNPDSVPTIIVKEVDRHDFKSSQGPFNYSKYGG